MAQHSTPDSTSVRRSSSLVQVGKAIVRQSGVQELYRGFGVSVLGGLSGPLYVSILESGRARLTTAGAPPPVAAFVGGAAASTVSQTFLVPLDIVTQHRMLGAASPYGRSSPAHIARTIFLAQGWRGMYRGFGVSLLSYAPTSAMIWSLFSAVHPASFAVAETLGWHERGPQQGDPLNRHDLARLGIVTALAGAVTGAVTGLLTNPVDLIRTRIQVSEERTTVARVVRGVVAEHGLRGFTLGASARAISMTPTTALLMTGYQLLKVSTADTSG